MLEELRVENFAVIDQLELRFGAGFQVITGETGAGKSILIDAVELLLGGRADPTFVRAGSQRSIIEGVIRLDERARQALLPALQREELIDPDAPDYLTIRREIRRRGRSSARINGVPVRSDLLTEIGGELFDIHGQSQHLSLFRPRRHIDLLDRYAGLLATRAGLADLVADLAALQAEMRALADGSEALARRADMLRHELDEIQAANLDPAEEDELQKERNRLANSEQLAQLAGEAARLLDDNDDDRGAVDKLMGVAGTLLKLTQIDPQLSEQYDQAESLAQAAQELALELARYAGDAEYDPQRLNELEERLELIRNLKRRHNVDTVQDILDYARRAQTELDSIDHSDERLQALGAREERLLRQIGDISWRLSQARAQAGDDLSAAVVRELSDLRMERTRFDVRLAQA